MNILYVFPGQGSQAVGMGKDLADNFAAARACSPSRLTIVISRESIRPALDPLSSIPAGR